MDKQKINLLRDLGIIALSIFIAVILIDVGALDGLLEGAAGLRFISSLVAGMFFVLIFTAAPAAVVLFELAAVTPIWEVAIFGGIGALLGDLLIFGFVKDKLTKDVEYLVKKVRRERFFSVFRLKFFRWFVPFLGALIVASPIPDEIGLAMMGFSKMRMAVFAPISFALNFLGILIIGLIARGIV